MYVGILMNERQNVCYIDFWNECFSFCHEPMAWLMEAETKCKKK